MAAGLSLEEKNIELLQKRLNENCPLSENDFIETVRIDKLLNLSEVTYELAKEILMLEPFGKGNREPLFGSKNVVVEGIKMYEDKNTIIFSLQIPDSYRKIKAVRFGRTNDFTDLIYGRYDDYEANKILSGILRTADLRLDIIYFIGINEYNNNVSVELRIRDFRISE